MNPSFARHLPWLMICLFVAPALAQTDAGGLLRPWPADQLLELQTDAVLLDQGHIQDTNQDVQLSVYESSGRWRLSTARRINPTVGYDLFHLDIDSDEDVLPPRLVDQSVGFGTPLAQFDEWFLAAAAGIGYAGNNPFADGDAWYAKGTLILGREIGEEETLLIGLDYNGSRPIYPDIPLPGFAYTKRIDPQFLAVLGFPYSSVLYKPVEGPLEGFTAEVIASFSGTVDARLGYDIVEELRIFANFENRLEAFTIDDTDDHDRLLFQQRRVEAGVRWQPTKYAGLVAAVGYAFGQEFSSGWDNRDTDEVADISDETYVRFGVEVRP